MKEIKLREPKEGEVQVRIITVTFNLQDEKPNIWARYELTCVKKGEEDAWDTPALGFGFDDSWSVAFRDRGETEEEAVKKASGILATFLQETRDKIVDLAVHHKEKV